MKRLVLGVVLLFCNPLVQADLVDYVITGVISPVPQFRAEVEIGGPNVPTEFLFGSGSVTNSNGDSVAGLLAGQEFSLTFTQDTSVPLSNDFTTSAFYTNALSNMAFSIDGAPAAASASGNFFGSTNSNQHQWSFFGGLADSPEAILDDGSYFANYDVNYNGGIQSSTDVGWGGIDFFLLDKQQSLFSDTLPNNAPFFTDSFDQQGDSTFLDLVWFGFDSFQDINGNDLDVFLKLVLDAEITGISSSATPVPVPAAIWFMGSALFGLFAARRRQNI